MRQGVVMRARHSAAALAFALGATALIVPFASPAHAKGYNICPASTTTVTWDGAADDGVGEVGDGFSWDDAWNWDLDCIPGEMDPDSPDNDIVVIGSSDSVELTGDEVFPSIASLQNAGTLTMTTGSQLMASGDSSSRITEMHGWLQGEGVFTVTERMDWESIGSAATMSTRPCLAGPPCDSSAPPIPGVTEIQADAVMNVNGLGVNLSDRRIIKNYGTVVLSGNGYIAAGYGTTFRNIDGTPMDASVPAFTFENNLGYYQGHALTGETLGVFRNSGVVQKTMGSGTSVVDARYFNTDPASASEGTVEVQTGQLSLLSPHFTGEVQAEVTQGASLANGTPGDCATDFDPSDCTLKTSPADTEAVSLDLTKSGMSSAPVTLKEMNQASPGFGVPVLVESPGAVATTNRPMKLRIYLDASEITGPTRTQVARKARVQRQATTLDPYLSLPSCAVVGGSTPTRACVNRAASVNQTQAAPGGDAVIVVETQQNSRYRVGRIPNPN